MKRLHAKLDGLSKSQLGWVYALANVLVFWGIYNVFMSYSTQVLQVNKIIFALTTYASCSMCLLAYARDGALSKETLRSIDTWAYGLIMLLNYFIVLNLFSIVSATEGTLIQRLSVCFSLLASWFFLSRTPTKLQLLGATIIFGGVVLIVNNVQSDKSNLLWILMFFAGIFQSLRIFIAETHRPHKVATEAHSLRTRCRVVGYVMFIITILFGSLIAGATYLQDFLPEMYKAKFVIQSSDFFHYPSILAGMVMGVCLYAPVRFLEFSIAENIKTENFLAVGALSFFATWFWEWATSGLTHLTLKQLSSTDILAGVIITSGALIMAYSKIKASNKKVNKETSLDENLKYLSLNPINLRTIKDSEHIINVSLQYFNYNLDKVSKALEIPKTVIKFIIADNSKSIALKSDILKRTSINYTKNIALTDPLTGVLNKAGFMLELQEYAKKSENLSLLFIDLNNFKPVNDTYGHDAGDFILQKTAERLQKLFKNAQATIARWGGDEFCVLLNNYDCNMIENEYIMVKQEIEKDFVYKNNTVNISSSIGLARYPIDTKDFNNLVDIADKNMYKDKKKKGINYER